MGRTRRNEKTDFENEDRRSTRKSKHARNIPGVGMRTINNPEEFFDDILIDEKIAMLLNNARVR